MNVNQSMTTMNKSDEHLSSVITIKLFELDATFTILTERKENVARLAKLSQS